MVKIERLSSLTASDKKKLFIRFGNDFLKVMTETVIPIVNDIRESGDKSVLKYTQKFDGISPDKVMASENEIEEGYKNAPADLMDAFRAAALNIRSFHEHQRKDDLRYTGSDGTTLGYFYHPIESAAIYVPGGKASYPSTVLMGVIPAQIAGTEKITVITPPGRDGKVPGIIAAVCRELGVSRIIKSGGAQGIAAAALGTESVDKSDIIVGPGNIFVTAAKAYLFSMGIIQIDSLAGPSEVLIIADENADPEWVAWDMLSQAEHEEMAIAILVTTSEKLAVKVKEEIERDINSKTGRFEIKERAVKNGGLIIIAESIEDAVNFSNSYGPEHMELAVAEPLNYLGKIKNTGSLFLGDYAPVALGDYYSGTNHILPTGGAARFSSGTSVDTFMRRTTYQYPTRESLRKALDPVKLISGYEGFGEKHGGSLDIRFRKDPSRRGR